MVNNIVYFGRIIATILLIRPISLIRLIRLISLIRPIRLISPILLVLLISHSRATLAPLLSPPLPPSSVRWTPDSGNRTPSRSFCMFVMPDFIRSPVPKVLRDLTDLRDPFAERECKDTSKVRYVFL